MRTLVTDIRDAVEHLPPASVLVLDQITWPSYEKLLECFEHRPGLRVTYDHGRLELVTTSSEHEHWKEFILRLVHVLCEDFDLDLQTYGSATQKRKSDAKGTEPDTCFYIRNARRVIGRSVDILNPPPDIVVEVDKSNQSLSKFPIYATFGVLEIWRCDVRRKRVMIYELEGKSYIERSASPSLPILTGDVIARFVEQSHTDGQSAAIKAFRRWLKTK